MIDKQSSSWTKFIRSIFLVVLILLIGCHELRLSARQKVIKESHDAVCQSLDIKAMLPFVSKSSQPLLELSSSLSNLSQIFLGNLIPDRIAVECQSSNLHFVDEIKVTDQRYIVRTRKTDSSEFTETIMVLENGVWKISLLRN